MWCTTALRLLQCVHRARGSVPLERFRLLLHGVDAGSATVAGILIGLAYGAELDVFAYLTTRYFGLRNFGSLFGGILFSLSLGAGLGPVLASHIFDTFGNYTGFMWLTVLVALMCSACFMSLPKPGLLETE